MSTVPEVIAAAEIGLRCAVVSLVSNHAAGIADRPLTHSEVTEEARRSGGEFVELLSRVVERFDPAWRATPAARRRPED
jgi:purine nucleoside phosphorylase